MKNKNAPTKAAIPAPAATISDVVEINDVRLVNITAEAPQGQIDLPVSVECLVNEVSTSRTSDGKTITVQVAFAISGKQGGGAEAKPIFKIDARFLADYSLPAERVFEPKAIDAFGKTNGVFNIWPYWRELVQSITTRMGLPPLTLSVFRIASSKREAPRQGADATK